jgi:predicted deacylase
MNRNALLEIPELVHWQSLLEKLQDSPFRDLYQVDTLGKIPDPRGGSPFPIQSLRLGPSDPRVPTLALVGGVHGIERIGTQVVLAYLSTLLELWQWDEGVRRMLEHLRIVGLPIVNPVGIAYQTRSNGQGVDLMRNAPVESDWPRPAWMIYRGHRLSPKLPWYRGKGELELENQILCSWIEREVFPSRASIALDVHSGFGSVDRVWFPYAKAHQPFADLPSALGLKTLLDRTLPYHVYRVEPQSAVYTVHGDVWDYLYDRFSGRPEGKVFLPLTLEMGSWNWLRKNYLQVFRPLALFHPIKPHRIRRTLRRHAPLLDFLARAVRNPEQWVRSGQDPGLKREALGRWFPQSQTLPSLEPDS